MDEMMEGGFERDSTVLVIGGCGSGKSTLSMQYLYNGATQYNEPGLYVTFEENPGKIKKHMGKYGWDLDVLEKEGKLKILRINPRDAINMVEQNSGEIIVAIEDFSAKRVVVDSISIIESLMSGNVEMKEGMMRLCERLTDQKTTSVIITEAEQGFGDYSRHGIMEFIVDGVIVLYNIQTGNLRSNALEVLKMRGTNHHKGIVPFRIAKGIEVFPREQVYRV